MDIIRTTATIHTHAGASPTVWRAPDASTPARSRRPVPGDGPGRLHASESPYGASPAVDEAIAAQLALLHRYPDTTNRELIAAIAQHHGVGADQVAVGNGLDEIILMLVLALGGDGGLGVVTDATFRSYAEALTAARRPFIRCPLVRYRLPTDDIARCLRRGDAFAFACNPHNPTGTVLRRSELAAMSRAAGDGGSMLIVDEAYAEYAGDEFCTALPLAARSANVCVLRTFSKAYGLAGLRVGYVVGPARLIASIKETQRPLPYSVNRLAQAAAIAALSDQEFLRRTVRMVVSTRDWFTNELTKAGVRCLPSATNFVLVDVGAGSSALTTQLRERGHLVRDTGDMGLPGHVRISIGTRPQMRELLDVLADLLDASAEVTPITRQSPSLSTSPTMREAC